MNKLRICLLVMILLLLQMSMSMIALTEINSAFYFLDPANVLSEVTKLEIYNSNLQLLQFCDAQITMVVLEDISGGNIGKYATGMGDLWGVGENGFLLLITISNNEYHAFVGENLQGAFPKNVLQELYTRYLEPNLYAGNYDAAVQGVFEAVYARIAQHYNSDTTPIYDASEIQTFGSAETYDTAPDLIDEYIDFDDGLPELIIEPAEVSGVMYDPISEPTVTQKATNNPTIKFSSPNDTISYWKRMIITFAIALAIFLSVTVCLVKIQEVYASRKASENKRRKRRAR